MKSCRNPRNTFLLRPFISQVEIALYAAGSDHFLHLNKSSGGDKNCSDKSQLATQVSQSDAGNQTCSVSRIHQNGSWGFAASQSPIPGNGTDNTLWTLVI